MSGPGLIGSVVIAGGGIAGWTAAVALAKALPGCRVDLVDLPGAEPTPMDLFAETTIPTVTEFHGLLGLDEAELVRTTNATFKLGTRLGDWRGAGTSFVHGYGDHGAAVAGSSFHQQWLRLREGRALANFESYSVAARAGREGRFAHPAPGAPVPFDYALHLDGRAYAAFLQHHAQASGVARHARSIEGVEVGEGRIEAVFLSGGGRLAADLFVDCTGPDAALIGAALGTPFEDWSAALPCDRVVVAEAEPDPNPDPLTDATATTAGWRWRVPLASRAGIGHVYSSAHLTDAAAAAALGKRRNSRTLRVRAGRRARQWVGNCLALGDAAVVMDPLEATNLHLVHSALRRLLAFLPGRDFSPIELWEFNRTSAREAEGVRDFLQFHYRANAREDSAFWRDCRALPISHALARKIEQFESRGRIVLEDEETFMKDSWLAVMLGMGLKPRVRDRLAAQVEVATAAGALGHIEAGVRRTVAAMPAHAAYLAAARAPLR